MSDLIDKKFNLILSKARENDLPLEIIKKAYLIARELHKEQIRKDGTPYIIHPIEVAEILANLNFDENVICGALLHDTIEDCEYSPSQMKKDFNLTIFNLVDCVSAIDNTKYVFDKNNIYEDEKFIKASAEEQTFIKLISLGKKNPCGFAIKFADRLHNLRTIGCFPYAKQLEKVRETEKWVIPIAKALKSEYFYRAIKNECFKIVNKSKGKQFFESYDIYHNSNKKTIEKLNLKLKETFAGTPITSIKIKDVREYKIIDELKKINKILDISKVSQGQIITVANYNVYLLFRDVSHQTAISEVLDSLSRIGLKVIDAKIGSFTNKSYLQFEDNKYNKYNIYVMSENEYQIAKVGTLDGQNLDKIDEDNINNLDEELIRVKTRSGEVKYIAKNSTVLDFAFKIHKDIGFGFKYAIINDGKTKFPPYTKINLNDKVEIVVDKSENGVLNNDAQLRWLAYVNTELAKKILVKYFENLIK